MNKENFMLDLSTNNDTDLDIIPISAIQTNTQSETTPDNQEALTISIADAILKVTGILYYEQLQLEISATKKVFLGLLNNISKSTKDLIIPLTNEEIERRSKGLFKEKQVSIHISDLRADYILFDYYQNHKRQLIINNEENYNRKKFLTIFNLTDNEGNYILSHAESLVFSYLLENAAFYARAGLGLITDSSNADKISKKLGISKQILKRAYTKFESLKLISFSEKKQSRTDKVVKPLKINLDISNKYSEKMHIEESENCKTILQKRYNDDKKNKNKKEAPTKEDLINFVQKLNLSKKIKSKKFTSKQLNQKGNFQQGKSNQNRGVNLIKKGSRIEGFNCPENCKKIITQPSATLSGVKKNTSILDIGKKRLGIELNISKDKLELFNKEYNLGVFRSVCMFKCEYGSLLAKEFNLQSSCSYILHKINNQSLDGLGYKQISELLHNTSLVLDIKNVLTKESKRLLVKREI